MMDEEKIYSEQKENFDFREGHVTSDGDCKKNKMAGQ